MYVLFFFNAANFKRKSEFMRCTYKYQFDCMYIQLKFAYNQKTKVHLNYRD